MQTIQTSYEVRLHSVVDATYRIEGLCNRILIYEESAFRTCLGLEFYNDLLSDMNSVSDVTEEWDEEKTYAENSLVNYRDIIYKAVQSNTNTAPVSSDKWIKVDKFKTSCYNELYNRYLKVYLSNYIVHNDLIFNAAQFGNKGISSASTDKSSKERTDIELLYQWRRDAKKLYEDTLELIKLWIEKYKDECKFSNVSFLNECDEDCTNSDEERIAW